jgi:hypothetical protein
MEIERITFRGPDITDSDVLRRVPLALSKLLDQINGFVQFHGMESEMRSILVLSLLLSASAGLAKDSAPATSPVEPRAGIVHGPDHSYIIEAPEGWMIDNGILADQGIYAAFYQAGRTFDESPIIAYSMVQQKARGGIEAHVQADMSHSLKGSKTAKVQRKKPLKTRDGREAIVFTLQGVPGQNPEWMAYIDAPTVVILVSVSVRHPGDFPKGEQLLAGLVSSISWFTENVHTDQK